MTIDEIKNKKDKLENSIATLIKEFNSECPVKIERIDVNNVLFENDYAYYKTVEFVGVDVKLTRI